MSSESDPLSSPCVSRPPGSWLFAHVLSSTDVAGEMEYHERPASFRQARLNPFDRGEEEEGGPPGGKTPSRDGECDWRVE